MKPQRIQRKRTRGFKLPPNTVSVTRPGKWSNPFVVSIERDAAQCVELYRAMLLRNQEFRWQACAELRGKNLACWCKLGDPCHADVLIEVVNLQ
jgi:Domain of unknown function (DUF4326)